VHRGIRVARSTEVQQGGRSACGRCRADRGHRATAAHPARAGRSQVHLDFSFNWKPLDGEHIELFEGFHLHHLPGHSPALLGLRLDLAQAGTFLLTSDQFHLRENYESPQPLGWLLRDHAWWRSYHFVKAMADRTGARLVFGHDADGASLPPPQPFELV
jgi:glyoxylase-like metal-dependent hydrolase (beta-lactamase superfamily II)